MVIITTCLHEVMDESGGDVIFFFANRPSWDVLEPALLPLLDKYRNTTKRELYAVWADAGSLRVREGAMEAMGVSRADLVYYVDL